MFFEAHYKLEGNYGKPFAAFPKPGGSSFLVWYGDERGNVYVVEAAAGKTDGIVAPKPVLAIEQPRETSRRPAP
jgi:hypothetical protein